MSRILIPASLMLGAFVVPAGVSAKNLRDLPKRIAKHCGTPQDWVSVTGKDEVHLQAPPDADYSKVDCILKGLQPKHSLKIGFVGNEADPNQVLNPAWSYIAGGSIATLKLLEVEVRKAGWIAGPLAQANDGTGFLPFHTPEGMTLAQATVLADRLSKHELGDITFGRAPSRTGSGSGDD